MTVNVCHLSVIMKNFQHLAVCNYDKLSTNLEPDFGVQPPCPWQPVPVVSGHHSDHTSEEHPGNHHQTHWNRNNGQRLNKL